MRAGTVWVAAVAVAIGSAVACGGGTETPPAGAPGAAAVDPATAATITGRVVVEGAVPKPEPITMAGDPVCATSGAALMTESFVVGAENGLENVIVSVKSGLGTRAFPAPGAAVVLDQKGCHYTPHVVAVQVGQPLEIVNSDDTLHNVHAVPKLNEEFNIGQPIKGMKSTFNTPKDPFRAREIAILLKCDVHEWMNAYVGVVEHPFFAVTSGGGRFSLTGLPPGTYDIEAWHEKLGTQTQTVTVGEKDTKDIGFAFKVS